MSAAAPQPSQHPSVRLMRVAGGGLPRYRLTLRPPLTEAEWTSKDPLSATGVRELLAACGLDAELVLNLMIDADNAPARA